MQFAVEPIDGPLVDQLLALLNFGQLEFLSATLNSFLFEARVEKISHIPKKKTLDITFIKKKKCCLVEHPIQIALQMQ